MKRVRGSDRFPVVGNEKPEAGTTAEERPDALWEDARRWPVLAWLRLKVPEPAAPLMLTRGPPPPPSPPVDWLVPEEVATDPTVRLFTFHERMGDGIGAVEEIFGVECR